MFLGIDGCKSGWVVVANDDGTYIIDISPDIQSIWEAYHDTERILIDIPIGFPDSGERNVEPAARDMLGQRRSSVFMTPVRPALYAQSYTEASELNFQHTGKKLSKQTWNITPKMREVDQFLQATPDMPLYESHPEVAFCALAGHPMYHSKKTGLGFVERLQIVQRYCGDAQYLIEQAVQDYKRDLVEDDVMDALVLAIAAGMDDLITLPAHPQKDRYNILMQIVYPQVKSMVQRIHHVQITIPEGQEAAGRAFYCGVLGLTEIEKPDALQRRGGFWLQLGDQQIHIGVEGLFSRMSTKAHIAYQVDDLAHWRQKIYDEGLIVQDSIPIPDYDRFECRDPFGNRIEFICEK